MPWFNVWGALIIAVMMVPNILYAIKCKDGFQNSFQNKLLEVCEQIGRFGCFGCMVVNIPGTVFGRWFDGALVVYLLVNGVLLAAYCAIWGVCFSRNSVFRALALSVLPCTIFLFSGVMTRSVLLTAAALLFAPCHVLISYRNAKAGCKVR